MKTKTRIKNRVEMIKKQAERTERQLDEAEDPSDRMALAEELAGLYCAIHNLEWVLK